MPSEEVAGKGKGRGELKHPVTPDPRNASKNPCQRCGAPFTPWGVRYSRPYEKRRLLTSRMTLHPTVYQGDQTAKPSKIIPFELLGGGGAVCVPPLIPKASPDAPPPPAPGGA